MIIRTIEESEIEIVQAQRIACYSEYKAVLPAAHWQVLKETLTARQEHEAVDFFVAVIDEQIVGSVVLFPPFIQAYDWTDTTQAYPEIRMLAVDPIARGKGVGRALINHCINVSKEKGAHKIGLHTGVYMQHAQLLYTALGFVRVPERDFEPMDDQIQILGFERILK